MDQEKKLETVVTVRPVYFRTMSDDSQSPRRFRDDDSDETGSQLCRSISLDDLEAGSSRPKWYRRGSSSLLQRWLGVSNRVKNGRGSIWGRRLLLASGILCFFGVIAAM